jgi:[glutamine synthetase] adenylyltransferase / [glutamine synthetase]-adenylyl-L-tyrosine phosphorylase
VSSERVVTDAGRLARLGFRDPDRARRHLASLPDLSQEVLATLAGVADADVALANLAGLTTRADAVDELGELMMAVETDAVFRARLFAVLGASDALSRHLDRHPIHWRDLRGMEVCDSEPGPAGPTPEEVRAELLELVGADPGDERPHATGSVEAAKDELRIAYRRRLLMLAARDLSQNMPVDEVAAELSDLAGATLEAALAIGRLQLGEPAEDVRLAVIALGKCGGRELNYVSDVDVVFVAEAMDPDREEAALRAGGRLAAGMMQACSDHTAEGTIWPVDAGLRPEGGSGPLVRTLPSHLGYYGRWAKTWEFQALLKARPIAGDRELGDRYAGAVAPLVWAASERDGFVSDVQAMRRRVIAHIPDGQAARQLKLGPGGLRDVEFAVQLLQLVHGRTDEDLRSGNTLAALEDLTAGGYVGRDDGAALGEAYRFLRSLEHRIQLWQLRRTHVVPEEPTALRRLGRSLGFSRDPVRELDEAWRRHAREVRRLHEKLFYRPLLAAVARLPGDEVRLSSAAARERLTALGYLDPGAALRHLEALTAGVSRRAAIQRTLLPAMLGWFADGPDPDAGLLAFRQVSDSLGSTHWYLRLLRDEGLVAERMAQILSSSRYATDLLMRAPESVAMLGDDAELVPRAGDHVEAEMSGAANRQDDPVAAITAVRAVRRRELLRIATGDLLRLLDVEQVVGALSDVTIATLAGALGVATRAVEAERRAPIPTRMAVVAMGRLGGHEVGYGSDADVIFVHDPVPGADPKQATDAATAVANELRRLLALPGVDPALGVDADLRPEGRQGPLVRTIDSYATYYQRWSKVWEAQALLRADPVCGDQELCDRFAALIQPLRWPSQGVGSADVAEIRRIKARVDAERLPRGADPATHTKLGRGGLADIEWTVQLLQLLHAHEHEGLRTTQTLPALHAAHEAGLVSAGDATALTQAWRLATRVRNAVMLVRGRPSDSLPRSSRERAGVAYACGYDPGDAERLVDDYLRTTRRASAVIDRLFWR